MNYYLCSGTSLAAEMEAHAKDLRVRGYTVTSRWHQTESPRLELNDPRITDRAIMDLQDIIKAHALIAFSGQKTGRGGRHFEAGFAYARGAILILIGEREHAFHSMFNHYFDSWEDFLAHLDV